MTDGVCARDSANIDDAKAEKFPQTQRVRKLGLSGECYDLNNAMDAYPLIDIVKAVEKAK